MRTKVIHKSPVGILLIPRPLAAGILYSADRFRPFVREADQGDDLSGVSAHEGEDPSQHHGQTPIQRPSSGELTRRNNPVSMAQVIHELSLYLQGWVGYFVIQEFTHLFRDLDAWIRSRLRATQLKKWKKPRTFQRIMIKAGCDPHEAHRVWLKMNRCQSVMRRSVRFVMNLQWFRKRGLVFLMTGQARSPEPDGFGC